MFGVQCGEKKEENWISVGVTGGNWKNSVKRIREHAATQYHMSSMVAFKSYLENKPIDSTESTTSRGTVKKTKGNRK